MALVIVSGLACSGRSTRSNQLQSYFQDQISKNSSTSTSTSTSTWLPSKVVILSDATVHSSKSIYSNQFKEKPARASYLSAVVRSLDPQTIVIADGGAGTNIKGFRYQLWCAARELRVRCLSIHVHAPPEKCRQWNEARRQRGEESYDPDTLDWLLQRFEEPTDMVRWDSPLFVLPSIDETETTNSNQAQTTSSTSKLTLEALEQVHQSTKIDSQDQQLEKNGLKEDTKTAIEKLLKSEEENRASKKKVSSSFQKRPIKKKVVAPAPTEEELGSNSASMQEDLKRLDLKDENFPSPPPSISPSSSSIGARSNSSSNPNKSSLTNQISSKTQDSTNPTFQEIWKIATSGKIKKPPNVVVVSKVTSSNYLSILENSTSKLINSLLDYQNSFGLPIGGGLISLNIHDDDGGNHKIDLNLPNNNDKSLTFTTLTKLRRSFVRVHSIGGSAGGEVMTKVGDDIGDSSVKKGDLLNDENESRGRRNGDGKRNKGKDEGKEESLEVKVARKFAIWLEQSL